jgi:uncharacterized protein
MQEDFASYAARLAASPAFAAIQAGVDACRVSCDYFELCGGGCPSNKFFEAKDFGATETLYCRIRNQYVADAVVDYIIASEKAPESEAVASPR